jgi:hypothetical protein
MLLHIECVPLIIFIANVYSLQTQHGDVIIMMNNNIYYISQMRICLIMCYTTVQSALKLNFHEVLDTIWTKLDNVMHQFSVHLWIEKENKSATKIRHLPKTPISTSASLFLCNNSTSILSWVDPLTCHLICTIDEEKCVPDGIDLW